MDAIWAGGLQALGKQLQGLASCKVDDDEDAGSGHMKKDSNAGVRDDLFQGCKGSCDQTGNRTNSSHDVARGRGMSCGKKIQ